MRIAIIGPGGMGGGIGRLLARAGHEVVFSGSRSPDKLARAAESAGPNARVATVEDAAAEADAVVVAVPFERYPDVAREAGEALGGKVVVDTSNPITVRDGRVEFLDLPDGSTAAEYQQRILGEVRLVKAFNAVCASEIGELAERSGNERVAILFAGDDASAKETAARLIADANFVPVDAGGLADASILEPSSIEDALPVLTEREARDLVRDRSSTNRVEQKESGTDAAA
jgi:hypothetical protein